MAQLDLTEQHLCMVSQVLFFLITVLDPPLGLRLKNKNMNGSKLHANEEDKGNHADNKTVERIFYRYLLSIAGSVGVVAVGTSTVS